MTESQSGGKPWDFTLVQRLINDTGSVPDTYEESPARKPPTLLTPPSLSTKPKTGIGNLAPVWALLEKLNTDAPPFRELERLPLPSWPDNVNIADREAYTSDGAAPLSSSKLYRASRNVFWESSEDEKAIESLESDIDLVKTLKQKDMSKSKKKKIAKANSSSIRQAVSDGEAIKLSSKALKRPLLPAVKAASHHIVPSSKEAQSVLSIQVAKSSRPVQQAIALIPSAVIVAQQGTDSIIRPNVQSRSKSATTSVKPTIFKHPVSNASTVLVDSWLQRDRVERDLAFRLKLIQTFPEDRVSLSQTVAFKQDSSANSIHVFIDFSNIWIGYMVHLQRLMGLSKNSRLKPQQRNLSFDSLVFLLERGRHAEKRILAGSWPWLPAFDIAKAIGYDSNILEKVQKNRDLTDEQRRDHRATIRWSGDFSSSPKTARPASSHATTGMSRIASGPGILVPTHLSSSQPQHAAPILASSPEKWVEQGVDELLQLKISHSLLDYDTPSTIVLATGDGAVAEYSDGFAKMLERVLKFGWKVELVSWKHCVNSIYSKRSWLDRWAPGQFRFIALEPFAEYLLDCA